MLKQLTLMTLCSATLLACGEKSEDTSVPEPANEPSAQLPEEPVEDCVSFSAEECSASDACATIGGVPMAESEDGACYIPGDIEIYGCISADEDCPAVVLFSFNPDESGLVQFPSGCLPAGWESVDLLDFQICED